MASGKWLRLDRYCLSKPGFSEILKLPNGAEYALIFCKILLIMGEVVPCDKQRLASRVQAVAEDVQQALNAFYKAGFIRVTDKGELGPPTLEEIEDYCKELNSPVDPQRFYDYYAADGFTFRGRPMDWRAKLRQWSAKDRGKSGLSGSCDPVSNRTVDEFMVSRRKARKWFTAAERDAIREPVTAEDYAIPDRL